LSALVPDFIFKVFVLILSLPYPPTGNHTTKHTRGSHYSTAIARKYKTDAVALIEAQNAAAAFSGPLSVVCEIYPPDGRRRDLDNVWKTLADSLTHAVNGKAQCVKDWCADLGLNVGRVYGRIRRGADPFEALR